VHCHIGVEEIVGQEEDDDEVMGVFSRYKQS